MNTEQIKQTFLFQDNESFFCPCGNKYSVHKSKEIVEEYTINVENGSLENMDVDDFIENIELDSDEKCSKCGKSSTEFKKYGLKYSTNVDFYKSFSFEETTTDIILNKNIFQGKLDREIKSFFIDKKTTSLVLNKESKRVTIKNGDTATVIELENLFKEIQNFYESASEKSTIKIMDNLIDIHVFIGRLANFLRDFKNIDLVSGLMEEINGTRGFDFNNSLSVLIKITCILLSIAQYENLSTIALVKSGIFLFELLKDCDLPSSSVLKEMNLTKPIQIFNYLINLEAKKIQENIDKNNKDIQEYAFKSIKLQSGVEIKISDSREFDIISGTKARKGADGKLILKENLQEKKISPFLFKKIKTVKEYKNLIRYCKFIDYSDLINLTMKYDSTFLESLFPHLEFRNDVNKDTINYFITLYSDFFSKKDNEYCEGNFENFLIEFDDAKRILVSLKWNIRKELMGIKKCEDINKYHNWLVKEYNNTVEKKESKIKYQNFVDKYKSLEDYIHNDIEVKFIDTVESLLFWAKKLNNSAAAYAYRVESGKYLMAMVNYKTFKSDEDCQNLKNFMLGLDVDARGMLEFDQFKSTNNRLASNKLKLILMEYLREKDISYKEVADLSLTEIKNDKINEAEFMYNSNISIQNANIKEI
jgi:hypothetical protein